ncbi:hypothetical protein [Caballeronia novacaledonica]|uniref:hypothetical protein n=1 Tax=Caballeronia novacaledonica TaxID=1544861 RepID=UPI0038571898
MTRLSVAPLPLLNMTARPLPIEKLDQLITPREVVWLIVSDCPPPLIEPMPATNCPPFGKGGAACVSMLDSSKQAVAKSSATVSGRTRKRRARNLG